MIRSINRLLDYHVVTSDGETCKLVDMLFDEQSWAVRYLVIKTGAWLLGRQVLLSPAEVQSMRDDEAVLQLSAHSAKVRESPATSTEPTIPREAELLLARHWDWLPPSAKNPIPPIILDSVAAEATRESKEPSEEAATSTLRRFKELEGYAIQARDGEIGHLEDLLCDEGWTIRYGVVDTRNWLPGKRVLLPVHEIGKIRWADSALHIDSSRERIKAAPAYDSRKPVSAADEEAVKRHFTQS